MSVKLYSFDIFDTLITRRVAKPTGIFALMQNFLQNDKAYSDFPVDVKTNFYKYRINCEYRQHRFNHYCNEQKDINLDQIYADIKETYALSDSQSERLKNMEIALELNNIRPIKENISKVKKLLAEGKRVVLISDMYLPLSVIKQLLSACDDVLPTLKLYLSSELGYTKSTGEMYKYVQRIENVDYSEWCHTGDNKRADYKRAKKLGIQAKLYKYVAFKPYEEKLLAQNIENPLVQLLLGCSKNFRLTKTPKFYDIAVSLGGAILYPYVSWLLGRAKQDGVQTLYFVARDGYILKKIADIIIETMNLGIKTEYLYGSRKAWRAPSLTLDNAEHWNLFVDTIGSKAFNKLDEVLGLSKEELPEVIPTELLCIDEYSRLRKRGALKDYLKNTQILKERVVEKNKQKRSNLVSYLKQTIDTSEKFAFVELDGTGYTQNCLCELMGDFYNQKVTTYYLASTRFVLKSHELLTKSFFYAFRKEFQAFYMELFTKAPHGQTLGYEQKDGRWQPILEAQDLLMSEDYYVGILDYVRAVACLEKEYPSICFCEQTMLDYYSDYICSVVDKETANVLGSIAFSFFGKESMEFAPKVGLFGAIKYVFTKKLKTESVLYSQIRSNILVRKIMNIKSKLEK